MIKKILIVVTAIIITVIIAGGLILFNQQARNSVRPLLILAGKYICDARMGDYQCSYGWGTQCSCIPRSIDGGKPCTDSSQCVSNKCIYDEFETHGDVSKCFHEDIPISPGDTSIKGKCQTYAFSILDWKCIGVITNGAIRYECGCAIQ